jgi:hypothetical protein
MASIVPFRDSLGLAVPWGYAFLCDGPSAEEVAELLQQAFGRRIILGGASREPLGAPWPSKIEEQKNGTS